MLYKMQNTLFLLYKLYILGYFDIIFMFYETKC